VSYAALQMNRDLGFNAEVYGFGAGVFFLGYALCEVPSNHFVLRFGARRWIARIMVTWGLLAAGMAFVHSPMSFYTMRTLLGIAEAGFAPAVLYYLSQWFPQEVRARAISRYYVGISISYVLSGLVAGLLLHLNGRMGLRGWRGCSWWRECRQLCWASWFSSRCQTDRRRQPGSNRRNLRGCRDVWVAGAREAMGTHFVR
jgi:ACS family tartrate transporter-like MFS transporter